MHPSDGKENGGGLQGQKVLKGQFLANERATDWVKGLLPANFFPLPFLFLFLLFSFFRLLSFIHAGVIFFRMLSFRETIRSSTPLCTCIYIYTYISPLVTRIKGLTRRANFLPSMRNLYAKIILIFISTRVTDSFYYRWNSR